LDDVMRFLYWQYYKKLQRGFTDAEFQQACETTAGISLNQVFEYVYTTKEMNYTTYLGYAGLGISYQTNTETGKKKYTIQRSTNPGSLQQDILRSLLGTH
jgi:predicted metalloprotease with PDZ domain